MQLFIGTNLKGWSGGEGRLEESECFFASVVPNERGFPFGEGMERSGDAGVPIYEASVCVSKPDEALEFLKVGRGRPVQDCLELRSCE